MEHKELISIIIPVYNVEAYLEKSVQSVCLQTYENLEIILVNDGSTDDSGDLCNRLAKQDNRVLIIHQENAGLSAARNTGTEAASGHYIFYLDSDDYISFDCVEILYRTIVENNAEIVQSNFYYDYPDNLLFANFLKGKEQVLEKHEAMHLLLKQKIIKNFAWGKLIRADIAKKHVFPIGKYFEDIYWQFQIIDACNKYVVLAKPMLYYLQRTGSISGTFSMRNLDQLEGEAIRLDFIKNYYPDLLSSAKNSMKKKLELHRVNLKKLSQIEQEIYIQKIEKIEKQYEIDKYSILNRMADFFNRIFRRIAPDDNFIKINK